MLSISNIKHTTSLSEATELTTVPVIHNSCRVGEEPILSGLKLNKLGGLNVTTRMLAINVATAESYHYENMIQLTSRPSK